MRDENSRQDRRGPDLNYGRGFAKLPRDMRQHPIMRRHSVLAVLVWLLCRVRHQRGLVDLVSGPVTLEAGQTVYGQRQIGDALGLGRTAIRTAERWLEAAGFLTRQPTRHGTLVTLLGYADFIAQSDATQPTNHPTPDPRPTHARPTPDPHPAYQGEVREEREVREEGEEREGDPGEGRSAPSPAAPEVVPGKNGHRKGPSSEERVIALRVLAKLNERTGRTFGSDSHVMRIVRLLRAGYTERDLRMVVWDRCNRWLPDERMAEYCRPSTLFGPQKFDEYLVEARAAFANQDSSSSGNVDPTGGQRAVLRDLFGGPR